MIIADSGSTKTTWCMCDTHSGRKEYLLTAGINPYYQGKLRFWPPWRRSLVPRRGTRVSLFYGAGCTNPTVNEVLYNALGCFFQTSEIEVESDMMAAARSCAEGRPE